MWQNVDTWLVLASLAVCVVALLKWIKDAGDDWLCDRSGACNWGPPDQQVRHAVQPSTLVGSDASGAQRSGA